jgi:hypothetical protein
MGDIAVARSVGIADSANTAAAARQRLRTKPGVEIEMPFMRLSSSVSAGNSKRSRERALASCPHC